MGLLSGGVCLKVSATDENKTSYTVKPLLCKDDHDIGSREYPLYSPVKKVGTYVVEIKATPINDKHYIPSL